jgi:hypothetical protein
MTLKRPTSESRTRRPADRTQASVRISVELNCLMCGREFGVLECGAWPEFGAATLRRPHFPTVTVLDWRQLRCTVCGGAAMPVEIVSRPVRTERPIDWDADKPRRGRPPKARHDKGC